MTPTDEQLRALELFTKGDSMVIEAGAGAGKTTTLRLLASDAHKRGRRGRYLAFNKAIVEDVKATLPATCTGSTAHSLAYGYGGRRYAKRLRDSARMRSEEIARRLDVNDYVVSYGKQHKRLNAPWLAGLVMRSVERYCQSADERPTKRHVPYVDGLDLPADDGTRRYEVNNQLAAFLEPALERAWADVCNRDGALPFKHSHYLKLWQLDHPKLDVDYILFDEAQDANPVMAAIVDEQQHAQRVYVGDANQAIYEWTGAVNSIEAMKASGLWRALLTQSFRFGPVIAGAANEMLALLGSDLVLRGFDVASTRGALEDVGAGDAVLCRTNAGAMSVVLGEVEDGKRAHLVGGGKEVLSFANAADRLMAGEKVWHADLACFDTWGEVQEYAEHDQLGGELAMLVKLVDNFGVPTIRRALDNMPREGEAVLTVSTAHKAKGREWDRVRIAADFLAVEPTKAERRLRYVAVTRARLHLDDSVFDKKKELILSSDDEDGDDDD